MIKKYIFLIIVIVLFSCSLELHCSEQKVSQETVDQLGDQLIAKLTGYIADPNGVKKLIEEGANVNKKGRQGNSPLLLLILNSFPIMYNKPDMPAIETLKYLLNDSKTNVNLTNNSSATAFSTFMNKVNEIIKYNYIKAQSLSKNIKELFKLFFARGADLYEKYNSKNFFDHANENMIYKEAYIEYLAELKRKHANLCKKLDEDLPFMSKNLTDLIAGYVQECGYQKKEGSA